MSELAPLVQKLSSPIPQIQARSLTNIFMKISHHLISQEQLLQFPQLPGLLLSWINDNKKKSQTLLKVIHILLEFTTFDKGKILLRRYQCLEFCEEFRIYLIQSERGIQMFLQALDQIIRRLLPLGRTDEESTMSKDNKDIAIQQSNKPPEQISQPNKKPQKVASSAGQSLKLICPSLPLDENEQKIIFEQLMKLKYAHKDTIYPTLTQIRVFVSQHHINTYRCRHDLLSHLYELALSNVFPELSIEIVSILLQGMFEANRWVRQGYLNKNINLTYAKATQMQEVQVQIPLPYKLFSIQSSVIVIDQLIKHCRIGEGATSIQYLLGIFYPYSLSYYLKVLRLASETQIISNQGVCLGVIQKYCQLFPDQASAFIQVLPEQIWGKVKKLHQYADHEEKSRSLNCIRPYLNQQFDVTKNLHIMRQIIDNLSAGMDGISLLPKECSKLYLQVLSVLAVSLTKQDPIMPYYNECQTVFIKILQNNTKQVVRAFYQQILHSLQNTKQAINYPGFVVPKWEVVEVLFSSGEFTGNFVNCALGDQGCLGIVLEVIGVFANKDKFKCFQHYVPILFALCWHPSQHIAVQASHLINRIPKNYTSYCIACQLFSSKAQNRRKLLSDLSSKPQLQMDIIQKLNQGQFAPKKKPLKISKSSLDNYFNIILNPSLQTSIKQQAISEFIDCIQRYEVADNNMDKDLFDDLSQARACLIEEIKKINRKEKFDMFQEKIVMLHLLLVRKIGGYGKEGFGLELLMGFLGRFNTQAGRAVLLTTIYLLVFQSPFTQQPNTKNFVMMYYPHIQVVKMKLEHPIHQQQPEQPNQPKPAQKPIIQKQASIFSQCLQSTSISPQLCQSLQQQLITSITTTNIPKISQLSFLFLHHPHSSLSLPKSTIKIINQYIRTNPAAQDLADDLIRIYRRRDEDSGDVFAGAGLVLGMGMMAGRVLAGDDVDRLMQDVSDSTGKIRLFKFFVEHPSIKFGSLNQYTNLKLIQAIISELRSSSSCLNSRILSLTLLYKLSTSQFNFSDHTATLLTLLYTVATQQKPTVTQLSLVLTCYTQLLHHTNTQHNNIKMTCTLISQLCTLVGNCCKEFQEGCGKDTLGRAWRGRGNFQVVFSGCFGFFNDLMRIQVVNEIGRDYFDTIAEQPQNMVILSNSLIPKQLTQGDETQIIMTTQILSFLFFYTCNNTDSISTLLNSTDILSVFLTLVTGVCADKNLSIHRKAQFFQSIGRFFNNIASKTDQFIFKINRILRNQSGNAEFKLHYVLMAPVPILAECYKAKQRKMYDHSYLKMITWIMFIWKQETNILEENDFIQPLISCVLQLRQVQILVPILTKSNVAQKLVASSPYISQKFKNWVKIVQELIFEKTKTSKKINQSKIEYPELKAKVMQGLVFATTIFNPTQNVAVSDEAPPSFKETVISCVRFVDQVSVLLQLVQDEAMASLWAKLVSNFFHNDLCSKILCTVVNEGMFETVNKLVAKIEKSAANIMEATEELQLLGSISSNESVRSLIIKNRIIQGLVKSVIAMDQNKASKINYALVFNVTSFLCFLSQFKDTNAKIQNEKKLIDVWAKILSLEQSQVVEQKILQLLINLSAFKHSKSGFMSSKQIHKVCLGLLSEPQCSYKQKVLCLVYNILYKNAAGIKLYKKKQICQLIENFCEVEELKEVSTAVLEVLNSNQ